MGSQLSGRQHEIYTELLKLDKKAAEAYKGALRVLSDHNNSDKFAQAAHSLRELNSLISRKVGLPQEAKEDEESFKGKLEKQFIEKPELLPFPVGDEVRTFIRKLVSLHNDFFVPVSHHSRETREEEFYSLLSEFEAILLKFLKPVPVTLTELDSLLGIQSPSEDDIKKLLDLLKHPTHVTYFFSRLSYAEWFIPLKEQGFFDKPIQGIREGNYIMFPIWPLSEYLTRVVRQKPREVMDVIKNMQETDNFRVHIDLINCALKMPSSIAKELVPLAKKWSNKPYLTLLPEKIGEFCIKLANEDELEQALDLLDALLDVKIQGKEEKLLQKRAQAHFDLWEYGKILKDVIPEFLKKEPNKAVEILCRKLFKAVELEIPKKDAQHDRSYIWRPAIERHEDRGRDVKNLLVSVLRDSLEYLGVNNGKIFKECYELLSKYEIPIFRRIEFHLMRKFPELLKSEIQKVLSRKEIFEDIHMWHEYYHLLREQYSSLPKNLKEIILKWIEEGPDLEYFISSHKKQTGKLPTDEQKESRKSHWQIRYLSAIKDVLPPEWKERWDELMGKYEESDHPDYHFYVEAGFAGAKSPLGKEDIKKMSTQEMIDYFKSWEPPKDFFAPSREGLGIKLRELVIEKPSDFTGICHQYKNFHPAYVYHLIDGFREAVKKGNAFDWKPVVMLCTDILTSTEPPNIPDDEDAGYDWKNAKRVIAELFWEGLSSDKVSPPFEFREHIFEIIKRLLQDDEPTSAYEEHYGGENMDSFTLSLNTIRGRAMNVLIRYALWCARCLNLSEKEDRMVPEVKEQLEKMLNPEVEPTMTVRSVYGESLLNLFYLNKKWAEKNISSIFPEDARYRALWRAAWEAYITYSRFFDGVYSAMKTQYRNAVNRLESPAISSRAKEGLSEDLMIAYLRGLENLGNKSLIKLFFEKADPEIRGRAIWFIGKELEHMPEWEIEDKEKEGISKRIMDLWEWRTSEAERANRQAKEKFVQELNGFGMWFINSPFSKSWSITQLIRTLELNEGKIYLEIDVIDSLQNYVKEHYLEALKALNLIIKGDSEGWIVAASREKIKEILEFIIKARPPQDIRDSVNDLVNNLTKKRHHEFARFFFR